MLGYRLSIPSVLSFRDKWARSYFIYLDPKLGTIAPDLNSQAADAWEVESKQIISTLSSIQYGRFFLKKSLTEELAIGLSICMTQSRHTLQSPFIPALKVESPPPPQA